MELIENLIRENHLEKVLASNLPQEIKQDWQEFFEEYEQKKETHYINSVEQLLALSKEEAEEVLYVDMHYINQEIIEVLYTCTRVKCIDLRISKTKLLKINIGKWTALRIAAIKTVLLKVIFEETFELCRQLYYLNISYAKLENLPESIVKLSNLQELDCSNNQLENLPIGIGKLNNLQWLHCSFNQLGSLPESISNLGNLQSLICSYNQLLNLPENIGNLDSLQQLYCDNNQLLNFPESIGNLINLQRLDCSHNQLRNFTESIGKLNNLQWLVCNNNQLQSLVESIGNLNNLKWLHCSSNQLQNLPESLGSLSNLEWLHCSSNQLQNLPKSIGNLNKLKNLDCSPNQLQQLPLGFSDLRNSLQSLDYVNNPFTEMPEIKEMGLGRLMDYLDEKRGRKPHKILWKMSKELHKTLQRYLVGFQDFVFTLSGKKIKLDVNRQEEGLELVIEPRELDMTAIDDYLALYVGDKLEVDFEALKSKFSSTELLQLKWFIKDLEFEKQILKHQLSNEIDKVDFLKKENQQLYIEIAFFQNQNKQLLELAINSQKQLEIKKTTLNVTSNVGLLLPADSQPNGWRKIKIFLASSAELRDVRMAFRDFLSTENDKYTEYGIYFEIVQWEFAGESISADSKQGDYNEKLKGCEVFLGLFWTKVGMYTEQEFNIAYLQFQSGKEPSILYTYFKELAPDRKAMLSDADLLSLLSFKNKLHNEIKHFQSNFTDINDLKVQLKHQIEIEILPKLLKPKV